MTQKSINNVSSRDEIIASIEVNGHQLASLVRYNFSNIDDVIRSIMSIAGNFVGLAKLKIRNKTQGWNMVMGVSSRRQSNIISPSLNLNHPRHGMQLSIPWP